MQRSILIIFLFLFQSYMVFSQTGWELIYNFPEDVASICFIDTLNGFAGSGFFASTKKIMKTTDAGNTWNDLLTTNNAITRIYFHNYNLGFAIGFDGTLYKTIDSGINWNLIPTGESEIFRGIFFLNEQIGWICCGSDKVMRTADGGNNWENSFTSGAVANWDIEFINESIGFAIGVYANMFKSSDGGINWNQVTAPMVSSLFDIEFTDENTGFIVGGSSVARTADGGNTWTIVVNSGGTQLNSVTTFENKFIWAAGGDKIYYSSNGGINWASQTYSPLSLLKVVNAVDSFNVWLLGDQKLYRTSSGGIISTIEQNYNLPEDFYLNQNFPNPFNPRTSLQYAISSRQFVTMKIFDLLGREVVTLVNEEKPAGEYEVEFNGSALTSGIYFYQLKAGSYSETRKMVLIK